MSGKIGNARFANLSKRYEQEQGAAAGAEKAGKYTDGCGRFLEPVQRYTDATTITKRISAERILYIAFYPRRIH